MDDFVIAVLLIILLSVCVTVVMVERDASSMGVGNPRDKDKLRRGW